MPATSSIEIYIPLWFYSNIIRGIVIVSINVIYIPLWFYSNLSVPASRSGSIYLFTFHYGSILICLHLRNTCESKIYIPLWFYSNVTTIIQKNKRNIFTFHYGSILIRRIKNAAKR